MVYITVPVTESGFGRQPTLEEMWFTEEEIKTWSPNLKGATRTYEAESVSVHMRNKVGRSTLSLIDSLYSFNTKYKWLYEVPRESLYHTFYIPKKSGGFRKIDAPNTELMGALRELKAIFENNFGATHHTSAFAYIKGRCTVDAVKRHQANESKWFGKYDLSNFFGSTTLEFTLNMLSMIYPFSEVMRTELGKGALTKALELCFLEGGLPQGTPISPLLTNIIMIPIDYKLANELRDHNNQRYIYTRYADDFIISSRYDFDFREIELLVNSVLSEFGAPFKINDSKTRYGSSSGRNYNLGLMLNSENKITVGHKNKKRLEAMLSSYAMSKRDGKQVDREILQQIEGIRSYYTMVEPDVIPKIVEHLNRKFGMDIVASIKNDLRA